MAQSEIGHDATAIDPLTGTIPLTPATPIHVARAYLRNTGEPAAVVFRSGRPVGVATAAALTTAHTASGADAPISTVMDHVTVPVSPRAGVNETVRTFTRAARDWLNQRPGPQQRAERRAAPTVTTVPCTPPATRASTPGRDSDGGGTLSPSARDEVEVPRVHASVLAGVPLAVAQPDHGGNSVPRAFASP